MSEDTTPLRHRRPASSAPPHDCPRAAAALPTRLSSSSGAPHADRVHITEASGPDGGIDAATSRMRRAATAGGRQVYQGRKARRRTRHDRAGNQRFGRIPPQQGRSSSCGRWASNRPLVMRPQQRSPPNSTPSSRSPSSSAPNSSSKNTPRKFRRPRPRRRSMNKTLFSIVAHLQGIGANEFNDIKDERDLALLKAVNPPAFQRFQQLVTGLKAVQTELVRTNQQRQARVRTADLRSLPSSTTAAPRNLCRNCALVTQMGKNFRQLRSRRCAQWASMIRNSFQHGAAKEQFNCATLAYKPMIADATRWRLAQNRARTAVARPVPPVQRPGVARAQNSRCRCPDSSPQTSTQQFKRPERATISGPD